MTLSGKHIALGSIAVFVLLTLFLVMIFISTSNREIRLRNQIAAQQDVNRVVFDNTWKIIKEQAGVKEQYKEAFKEIYLPLMANRYKGNQDGSLMKFVQEANPNFDIRLYDKLANSIEAQRTTFTNEQRKLRDLKNQHDSMLDTFPNSIILAGRPKVEVKLVTSTKTEAAFESEKDDELLVTKPTPTASTNK